MSYILDALRKADAERERDPARGIHAQPAAVAGAGERARAPRWIWVAGVAAVGVAAVLAFTLREAPPVPAVAGVALPTAPAASIAIVAAPAPAVVPVAATVLPAPPSVQVPVGPLAPVAPARPAAKTAVAVASVAPVAPLARAAPPAARVAAAPATMNPPEASGAAPAPASPMAAADRVLAYSELPADVQRDLPKLAISGGVHSENASQRMLIVGGQVMAEGAELAPGVTLEQIRAKSAVLRFRGLRYSVAY
jgi:general secretion pathway protein B